jgi:hypothetical protein
MPIPVGGSGDVDSEGRTEDGFVRLSSMAGSWWAERVPEDYQLREWLEPVRFQPGGSVCWVSAAFANRMAEQGVVLFPAALEPEPSLAELTDDADDNGPDDA